MPTWRGGPQRSPSTRDCSSDHASGRGWGSRSSSSSTSSVGARMNTSHIMSGLLLVAAHEADHAAAGRALDHRRSKRSRISSWNSIRWLDHGGSAAALEQRLLDAGETAAQHAHDEVVLVVGLRAGRAATVELLQQPHQSVGDRRQHVAVVLAWPGVGGLTVCIGIVLTSDNIVIDARYAGSTRSSGSRPSASRALSTGGRESRPRCPQPDIPRSAARSCWTR